MTMLVDTSVLGRLANTDDPSHSVAAFAVLEVRRQGESLLTAAQNLIEFRNFATRPLNANGLGLTAMEAEAKADEFESLFALVPDTAEIYLEWKAIVHASEAIGKQVHDARLVAICKVNRIERILTFNVGHFLRLAGFVPGMSIVTPGSLVV